MAEIAPQRVIMRNVIMRACSQHPRWNGLSKEQQDTLCRRMERNCFEVTIQSCTRDGIDRLFTEKKFVERYSSTCNRICVNLDPTSEVGSEYLLNALIDGKVDPYKIAEIESKDLCPDASKTERDTIELRQKQKTDRKVSYRYTCRKCNQTGAFVLEYQGRAADEGSNFSFKCIHCEHVWRT